LSYGHGPAAPGHAIRSWGTEKTKPGIKPGFVFSSGAL
jgi:hypothetical protein